MNNSEATEIPELQERLKRVLEEVAALPMSAFTVREWLKYESLLRMLLASDGASKPGQIERGREVVEKLETIALEHKLKRRGEKY